MPAVGRPVSVSLSRNLLGLERLDGTDDLPNDHDVKNLADGREADRHDADAGNQGECGVDLGLRGPAGVGDAVDLLRQTGDTDKNPVQVVEGNEAEADRTSRSYVGLAVLDQGPASMQDEEEEDR